MANFGELKANIADAINRTDLDAQIGKAINNALNYYKKEEFWFNTGESTQTLTAGSPTVPINLVSDFLQETDTAGLTVVDNDTRRTLYKKPPTFYKNRNTATTGKPRYYTWLNNELLMHPLPDQDYVIEISYLNDYSALAADADTNDFTENADLLLENYATRLLYMTTLHELEMAQSHAALETFEYLRLKEFSSDKNSTSGLTDWSV